jgi:hypothetical protein
MKKTRFPLLAASACAVIACGDSTATDATARIATIEETAMAEATSNSETLFNGLLELARGDASRVSELQRRLLDPAVLDVLDSKADYETEMPEDLYIAGLIQALIDRGDAAAHKVLSQLALAPAWAEEDARIELLIRALATVRPATPDAIAFWDKYSEPEDGFANLTIDACIVNGSSPAIDLVAKKLIDAKHSVEERSGWLYSSVVPHRNDETLLTMLESLMDSPVDAEIKAVIVDVIFDHRPEEWYSIHTQVFPPPRTEMSADSAAIVLRLADRLLQSDTLTDQQREAVVATKKQIENLREEQT